MSRIAFAQSERIVPVADNHQHLFSLAAAEMLSKPENRYAPVTAHDMIARLDSAGIQKALILSVAYMYGSPTRTVDDEYAKVRAENDWVAEQVRLYPDRLKATCSVNPLKPYALEEIGRCGKDTLLRRALKLHFGNSDVRTDFPDQLAQMKRVFRAANDNRMPIIVHMHANVNNKRPYGLEQGRVFLEELLPMAPDVPVQIAHLAGAGGSVDLPADSVVGVFADAITRHDPRVKNLWMELSAVVDENIRPDAAARIVRRIRQIGTSRILYGTDSGIGPTTSPAAAWAAFRKLPLTEEEFRAIASNLPPQIWSP